MRLSKIHWITLLILVCVVCLVPVSAQAEKGIDSAQFQRIEIVDITDMSDFDPLNPNAFRKQLAVRFPISKDNSPLMIKRFHYYEMAVSPDGNLAAITDTVENYLETKQTILRIYNTEAEEITNFEIDQMGRILGIKISDDGRIAIFGRSLECRGVNCPLFFYFYSVDGQHLESPLNKYFYNRLHWCSFLPSGHFYFLGFPLVEGETVTESIYNKDFVLFILDQDFHLICETPLPFWRANGVLDSLSVDEEAKTIVYRERSFKKDEQNKLVRVRDTVYMNWSGTILEKETEQKEWRTQKWNK